jgi:hypothetical protein
MNRKVKTVKQRWKVSSKKRRIVSR